MGPVIYDTPISVMKLPGNVGTPTQGKLLKIFDAYCGEKSVFHTRYWESVQSGHRVDCLVELPLHRDVCANMYAKYKGHVYSIQQAQFEKDENGLPVTVLSLERAGAQYDAAAV